jgi:hypothetical protein
MRCEESVLGGPLRSDGISMTGIDCREAIVTGGLWLERCPDIRQCKEILFVDIVLCAFRQLTIMIDGALS